MVSLGKRHLQFLLVHLVVRVHPAVKERRQRAQLVRTSDAAKVQYTKTAGEEREPVAADEIGYLYEASSGAGVIIDPAEFKAFIEGRRQEILIDRFLALRDVPPELYEKPYYLSPEEGFEKAYRALAEAMRTLKVAAVTKFFLKGNREHLGIVRPVENVLLLHQCRYPEDLQPTAELSIPDHRVPPEELKLAQQLIRDRVERFDPKACRNTLVKKYQAMIDERAKGREPVSPAAPAPVADLFAALTASVQESQRSPNRKPPRRMAPSKRPSERARARPASA